MNMFFEHNGLINRFQVKQPYTVPQKKGMSVKPQIITIVENFLFPTTPFGVIITDRHIENIQSVFCRSSVAIHLF